MRFPILTDFLALVFPRTCSLCQRSLFDFENQLCRICAARLPVTKYYLRPYQNDLSQKLKGLSDIQRVISFLRFTKQGTSQKLLHQLKYKGKAELGNELGRLFAYQLADCEFNWDMIVPVPLHPIKLKRRGYNQSLRFADGLGEILDLPVQECLKRVKFTSTQTKKSRMDRIINVEGVFAPINEQEIQGKYILLVDDVMTTGATLSACANVLLAEGAEKVDLAVIAAGK
ncbi:ComF family protein [Echinicola jeungdonensis]|uniref:ComF family protein n=1 Tax=Echinicola jeungdonensis TaxID=709343 RepID=A0ABV5J7E6_9BACT|nr:ComF family protein [Echinicola jeungdonensis]MDN3669090.1 ComF family protein [Echinicola jeungdonensis]